MRPESPSPDVAYPWRAIYALVAGALVLEIAAFALLGWIYL